MRNLTGFVIALAVLVGLSTLALADHGDEVDGLRESTDIVDGSQQMLRISERADGTFSIGYIDFLATQACEPDAFFRSGGQAPTTIRTTCSPGRSPIRAAQAERHQVPHVFFLGDV